MDLKVVAVKAFPYRGRDVRPGETVDMESIDASFYHRYGFVIPPPQQTYLTRDLIAQ